MPALAPSVFRPLLVFVCTALALLTASPAAAAPTAPGPLRWVPLGEPGVGGFLTAVQVSPHDSRRVLLGGDMLGIGVSNDGGSTWQPSVSPASEIGDFSFHPTNPEVIWAGSMSGPLLSTDGGRTFTLRREGFPPVSGGHYSAPVEVVRFDPTDSGRLLAFGGSSRRWSSPGKPAWGAVWESRNGGRNWTRLTTLTAAGSSDSAADGLNIVSAAFSPANPRRLFASLHQGGVLVSNDSGRTWEPRNHGLPGNGADRIALHPTDADIAYVAIGNHKPAGESEFRGSGIFKTTDGGRNWTRVSNGLAQVPNRDWNMASRYGLVLLAPGEPDTLFTADSAWNGGVIYRSRDGGASWTPVATRGNVGHADTSGISKPVFKPDVGMFAGLGMSMGGFDPANPSIAFLANMETVLRTTDGGDTWQDVTAERVTDAPRPDSWRGTGYTGWCSTDIAFAPDTAGESTLMAMDAAKIWRSSDDFRSWTYHGHKPWPWGGGIQAVYAGPWIYATAGQHGSYHGIYRVHRETNEVVVFQGEEHGLPKWPGNVGLGGIHAHPSRPDTVYAVVRGGLMRSDDAGKSWRVILERAGASQVAGDPRHPDVLYVSGRDGVLRSTDGGAEFKLIGGPRPAGRGRLRVAADGRVYVTLWREARSGLWRWSPETGWRRLFDETYAKDVAIDPADPTRLAVVTNDDPYHDLNRATGVWLSADDGATWRRANEGLPMLRGQTIAFDPHHRGRVVMGTFGRGFFLTDWPAGHQPAGTPRRHVHDGDDAAFATPDDDSELVPGLPPLRNTSMTKGGREAVHWTRTWIGSGRIEVRRDTEVFFSPPASLRIASIGGPANGQVMQQVAASPGQTFTVSGQLRTAGSAKVNAALQFYDASGQPFEFLQLRYAQNTSDWGSFIRAVTVPPRTATVAFVVLLEGDGRAWVDDFAVSP